MVFYGSAINSISIFILLVLATFHLRARGILKSSNVSTISRFLTELVLPAYLFNYLTHSHAHLSFEVLKAAGSLVVVEFILASIAYPVGKYCLKLTGVKLAIFVLCSTFSSTGLIGNTFIKLIYDTNTFAITEGILIGQLAITTPNYLITSTILSKFDSTKTSSSFYSRSLSFFLIPPNTAIFLGLLWAVIGIETNHILLNPIFGAMNLMGVTLPFLAAIIIGLSLNNFPDRRDLLVVLICGSFVLIAEPILTHFMNVWSQVNLLDRQVSFLLGAMPGAPLIAIFAARYDTEPKFASTLITGTTIMSAVTIPFLIYCFRSFLI